MAWIETLREDEWDDPLAGLRPRLDDSASGRVDNIMQVHSLNSQAMAAHLALYESAMRGTKSLRRADRELIAVVVSNANECHY